MKIDAQAVLLLVPFLFMRRLASICTGLLMIASGSILDACRESRPRGL